MITRFRKTRANADTCRFDTKFMIIHTGQRLTKHFGHAVQPIGFRPSIGVNTRTLLIEPSYMVRTSKDNARTDRGLSRRLKQVYHSVNIRGFYSLPWGFRGLSAHMYDAVAPFDQCLNRNFIRKIAINQLFV